MAQEVSGLEKCLLRGKWTGPIDNPTAELAEAVLAGKFRQVLTSPAASRLLCAQSPTFNEPFDKAFHFESIPEDEVNETQRLIVAIACLHAFVQVNWTGPDLDVTPSDIISTSTQNTETAEKIAPIDDAFLNQKAIAELAVAGEPAYPLTKVAAFLKLAQVLLAVPFTRCLSVSWWRLRATIIHQQVLDEPAPVSDSIITSLDPLKPHFKQEPDLSGQLVLEQGLLEHLFSHDRSAAEFFVRAAQATAMQFELTGALGKRTKFQQTALSQLVLLAQSNLTSDESPSSTASSSAPTTEGTDANSSTDKPSLPDTLPLNDDTLLERTEFTSSNPSSETSLLGHINPSNQPPLHPIDQCILLAMCLNVKNTSPSHGLTNEQMSPYVERVITHPRNWSIHTMALLLRSRLESTRTRTAERSTLQLQALIDQMPTADSTLQERLLYFHSIPLPSKWELERELAQRFMSLGITRSALETFERLEMWEDVVKCYAALEKPEKAIVIVRDLLEGRRAEAEEVVSRGKILSTDRRSLHDKAREAKLWCLLGDLEPDHAIEHYERAWKVSQGTSGRAMRSLGGHYFGQGLFKESVSALKRAVAINPLMSKSWFILGCACMRIEDWEEAKSAFVRCVTLDEDDAESWNNLANVYLRMGKKSPDVKNDDNENEPITNGRTDASAIPFDHKLLAFRALKQGLRFSYENWRMWYNYMVVSVDVGELFEASRALGRIVEETGDKVGVKAVDEDVLERLVNAATRAKTDTVVATESEGQDASVEKTNEGLVRNVTNLIERIILPRASSPRIFRAYARLLTSKGQWNEAIKAYLDAYRCGSAGTMEKGDPDIEKWREAVTEVEEIVDVLTNFGPRADGFNWRLQARSLVKTFMGRTKDFEDEPEWERLKNLEEDLRKVAD